MTNVLSRPLWIFLYSRVQGDNIIQTPFRIFEHKIFVVFDYIKNTSPNIPVITLFLPDFSPSRKPSGKDVKLLPHYPSRSEQPRVDQTWPRLPGISIMSPV